MALDSAKKFMADVAADEALKAKIAAVQADGEDAVVAAAKDAGYDFTADELKEATRGDAELSVDELENVAGGAGRCEAFGGGNCKCFAKNCIAVLT